MEITLRYNTFEFVKLATEYFCASTFVREGISSPSHPYDGSILKACSQCKHTHYKDTAAQKSAWKFHKQNYKKSTPSNINYINKLNLSQTTDEAKMVLFKPKSSDDVSHCLFYLLRRIRKAFDERDSRDYCDDAELQLHTRCQAFTFSPSSSIHMIWNMPGMTEFLLTCNKEDLLCDSARFTKRYFGDIYIADGAPMEEWIDTAYPNTGDEVEQKRSTKGIMDHYELHGNMMGSSAPSSIMKIDIIVAVF